MADSGPSRRHGWIPRVRVIPGNGFNSFRELLGIKKCRLTGPLLQGRPTVRELHGEDF